MKGAILANTKNLTIEMNDDGAMSITVAEDLDGVILEASVVLQYADACELMLGMIKWLGKEDISWRFSH